MRRTVTILMIILLSITRLSAQTFYGIVMADTDDETIGAGCTIDVKLVSSQFKKIASGIGYKEETIVLVKEQFNEEALRSVIKNLQCGPEDVVFFYYSGHGYNLTERTSSYPLLQISKQREMVRANPALEDMHAELCKKGARFVVTVGDCCNEAIDADLLTARDAIIAKFPYAAKAFYRKLFLENRGNILITSARPPQLSPTHPQIGSLYTVALTQAMTYGEAYNNKSITWAQLLSDADNRLLAIRNDFRPTNPQMATQIQIPVYDIALQSAKTGTGLPVDSPSPEPQTVSSLDYDRVNRYLNSLVNQGIPQKERYELSKNWKNYFIPGASVDIYVNTTLVEKQNIESSVMQLYLNASLIRSVNFIADLSKLTDDGKKYRSIAIQQIRH